MLLVPLGASKSMLSRLEPTLRDIAKRLKRRSIEITMDLHKCKLGKKHVKHDSMGTPLAIIVDEGTSKQGTVTLRDRDTKRQVRGKIDDVLKIVEEYSEEICWDDVEMRLPRFGIGDRVRGGKMSNEKP